MLIRPALSADARPLARLGERLWRGTYEGLIPESDLAQHLAETFGPERQQAELADRTCTTLLIDDGGALLGYALLRAGAPPAEGAAPPFTRPLEVARFYVDPLLHGTGAAGDLMTAVLSHASAAGHDGVWLQVWERNPRAIRFYARAGFTGAGETTFPVGDLVYRDHLLVHTLMSRKV